MMLEKLSESKMELMNSTMILSGKVDMLTESNAKLHHEANNLTASNKELTKKIAKLTEQNKLLHKESQEYLQQAMIEFSKSGYLEDEVTKKSKQWNLCQKKLEVSNRLIHEMSKLSKIDVQYTYLLKIIGPI